MIRLLKVWKNVGDIQHRLRSCHSPAKNPAFASLSHQELKSSEEKKVVKTVATKEDEKKEKKEDDKKEKKEKASFFFNKIMARSKFGSKFSVRRAVVHCSWLLGSRSATRWKT